MIFKNSLPTSQKIKPRFHCKAQTGISIFRELYEIRNTLPEVGWKVLNVEACGTKGYRCSLNG
jgi:hypothetical protein